VIEYAPYEAYSISQHLDVLNLSTLNPSDAIKSVASVISYPLHAAASNKKDDGSNLHNLDLCLIRLCIKLLPLWRMEFMYIHCIYAFRLLFLSPLGCKMIVVLKHSALLIRSTANGLEIWVPPLFCLNGNLRMRARLWGGFHTKAKQAGPCYMSLVSFRIRIIHTEAELNDWLAEVPDVGRAKKIPLLNFSRYPHVSTSHLSPLVRHDGPTDKLFQIWMTQKTYWNDKYYAWPNINSWRQHVDILKRTADLHQRHQPVWVGYYNILICNW
jgi:hypothetical protein